jgi:hypothetical protein
LLLPGAAAVLAAAVAAMLLVGGGASSPAPYGARLVRFAESTPLLLLEGPGWQVRNVIQFEPGSGSMEFGPGPAPEATASRRASGPPSTLQSRAVKLQWLPNGPWVGGLTHAPAAHGYSKALPVLGTRAHVRIEKPLSGEPAGLLVDGFWTEGSRLLLMSARVPDLSAFRARLGWLHHVDPETWLEAMPPRVVKAAEYGAEAKKMLKGLPLPPGFHPAKVPDLHLTTNRYSVGRAVGGAVACGWFGAWFAAHDGGRAEAARRARRVLLGAGQWPVFKRIRAEGNYPGVVLKFARYLPSGHWPNGRPLRPMVELQCRQWGSPIGNGAPR